MRRTPCRRNENACARSAVPHSGGRSPEGSLALLERDLADGGRAVRQMDVHRGAEALAHELAAELPGQAVVAGRVAAAARDRLPDVVVAQRQLAEGLRGALDHEAERAPVVRAHAFGQGDAVRRRVAAAEDIAAEIGEEVQLRLVAVADRLRADEGGTGAAEGQVVPAARPAAGELRRLERDRR